MDEEKIRNSFLGIRTDIVSLKDEISELRGDFSSLLEGLSKILDEKIKEKNPTSTQGFQTDAGQNPADNSSFKPLKTQNLGFSIGNQGVPTDRQTDRQTDRHLIEGIKNSKNPIKNALYILDSLDSVRKEIRLKFKRLTNHEFLLFSTLYQMEEEGMEAGYKSLSEKLGLTESSIRDYVGRLIKKGIPIEKTKVRNKNILLSVSPDLKKIASLSAILQLRDI